MNKKLLCSFWILLVTLSVSAQKLAVEAKVDSSAIKIGAQLNLVLKTKVPKKSKVIFPEANQFGDFEVLESYPTDTIKKSDAYELVKRYGLTKFDSGKYVVPRLSVVINNQVHFSDSISVTVADVVVDTLKQKMYDIKNIIPVKSDFGNWWIYLLILIGLAVIGYFVYRFIKKKKTEEKPVVIEFKSPIEKATSLLQQLEKKELWQKGEIKNYYSELTDIARNYIEEEIQIPAMESTTSELIEGLRNAAKQKKLKLSSETVENLEKVLKQADLVKFAKVKPLDFEIEEDKKRISNSIVTIHNSIPEIVEENDELELWNEQQKEKARQEKLKKEKRKRIIIGVSIGVFLIVTTLGILIAIKGFDYVKDNFIGHPTKDLVEGEWVFSEYGNPTVKIETPKVLKRMDAEKVLPKNAMALIKEMQIFMYGSLTDDFYIGVSTTTFKQQAQINLEQAAEGSLKVFEAQGATNIFVKTEEFDTQQGIKGRKAYGTMVMVDKISGKSVKMYYEILVFGQNNGLQQITIMHREDDKYGKQMLERILNSVELQNISQP